MSTETHTQDDATPRGWPSARRRRLAAAVVGLMMLGLAFESSENTQPPASKSQNPLTAQEEFDRIDALLAQQIPAKETERPPSVQVPGHLVAEVTRPAFDFDAFDEMMGIDSEEQTNAKSKPPERDSFSDLRDRNELVIPETLALGNGNRVESATKDIRDIPASDTSLQIPAHASSNSDHLERTTDAVPIESAETARPAASPALRILTENVTTSPIHQMQPSPVENEQAKEIEVDKAPVATPSQQVEHNTTDANPGQIRFTGSIFPISRIHKQQTP